MLHLKFRFRFVFGLSEFIWAISSLISFFLLFQSFLKLLNSSDRNSLLMLVELIAEFSSSSNLQIFRIISQKVGIDLTRSRAPKQVQFFEKRKRRSVYHQRITRSSLCLFIRPMTGSFWPKGDFHTALSVLEC